MASCRVVYALSEAPVASHVTARPRREFDPGPTTASVFAAGRRAIVVVGPLLEDEAAVPHLGFWR